MKTYSPYQFAIFRIILGIYLVVHFVMLIPYSAEIWSNIGLLSDASLNLTHGVFPNILNYFDAPLFVQIYVGVLAFLSLLFALGIQRPIVSLLLWYGWVSLFDRNNLISNPGIPFIGWLLLCCAVVPKGEPLSLQFNRQNLEEDTTWQMPKILFYGAWLIMAISYTISGVDKLMSPSWSDGTAIRHLLENPLARDWPLREMMLLLPPIAIKIMTWATLILEIVFLPLALLKKTRMWAWLGMVALHLGILMIVDFADLTIGMLMIHIFTFDGSWLKPNTQNGEKGIVFFDGVCGMCNSIVDFLMREDRNNALLFTPLQGTTAQERLDKKDVENLNTIAYYRDGKVTKKSSAVLQLLTDMGGIWKLAFVFKIVPKPIRDFIYDTVSKNRYKWFGKKEACRMPTKEERMKFLD